MSRARIATAPVGTYRYDKRRRSGASARAIVTVFPLLVTREAANWPERGERERRWFALAEAVEAVEEPELKELILVFPRCGRQTPIRALRWLLWA